MPIAMTGGGIRSVFAAIRAAPVPLRHVSSDRPMVHPRFVTISRQCGAGGHTIGQMLVNRLNALTKADEEWTLWDRQVVEKVSADHHLAKDVVDSLEDSGRTWLEDFVAALAIDTDETEAKIYGLVVATIRALAQKGRVVIVGRGGVYITRNMPGGVHLRFVAPLEYRVRYMANQLHLSHEEALSHVQHVDRQRETFYRRYWPKEMRAPEVFTLTINTSLVTEERAVESIIPLILPVVQAAHPQQVQEHGTLLM